MDLAEIAGGLSFSLSSFSAVAGAALTTVAAAILAAATATTITTAAKTTADADANYLNNAPLQRTVLKQSSCKGAFSIPNAERQRGLMLTLYRQDMLRKPHRPTP